MDLHKDQRVCIYPTYLDAEKSWAGGRRVPKAQAVEKPCAREMYDAVTRGLCLEAEAELDKKYSRDWMQQGRIRVQLKNDDGTPCNVDILNKKTLLIKCAELCAKHPDRPRRLADIKKFEAQLFGGGAPGQGGAQAIKGAASTSAAAASSGKAAAKSNKKKGSSKKK